jgi:hypothetical protein
VGCEPHSADGVISGLAKWAMPDYIGKFGLSPEEFVLRIKLAFGSLKAESGAR